MLFCSAKMNEIQNLVKCLDKYGKWSAQSINLEKSGVFASKGVHSHFLRSKTIGVSKSFSKEQDTWEYLYSYRKKMVIQCMKNSVIYLSFPKLYQKIWSMTTKEFVWKIYPFF